MKERGREGKNEGMGKEEMGKGERKGWRNGKELHVWKSEMRKGRE